MIDGIDCGCIRIFSDRIVILSVMVIIVVIGSFEEMFSILMIGEMVLVRLKLSVFSSDVVVFVLLL